MLIDAHCHLSFKDYAGPRMQEVLQKAQELGVETMVTIGAGEGIEGNEEAFALAQQYDNIYCAVGLHPHDASMMSPEVLDRIAVWAQNPKVVGLGEMGLDFYYKLSSPAEQITAFEQQIELSLQLNKPIVIHDREAGDQTYEILKKHHLEPGRVVIHCFTGDMPLAKKYLDLGFLLSFTGIITFKNASDLREVVKMVPTEQLMVETDSPFLAPHPFRGKTNEPGFVRYVAEAVAQIKGLTLEDVARVTTLNTSRFFGLPHPELQTKVTYVIRNSLYINMTNRCNLACRFCPKFVDYEVKGYYLKLQNEPSVEQVLEEVGDPSRYDEVVFCGYGEPTRRLDDLLAVSKSLKERYPQTKIRINTDGLGNLVYGRNIVPELVPFIDALSISLNASDAATYVKYCPSRFKEKAWEGVQEFIQLAAAAIPDVTASVVGVPEANEEKCRQLATKLGAKFRYRPLDHVG